MSTTPTKPAAGKPAGDKPARTYPAVVYVHDPGTPGYKAVEVKDADAEKALGVPVFDTAQLAAAFVAPLEQPIPHIARTQNEEQFVPGKSQFGTNTSAGVFQTPPPVKNVFVRTGVEEGTLALKAVLPDGVDPELIKGATVDGKPLVPAAPPAGGGTHSAPTHVG